MVQDVPETARYGPTRLIGYQDHNTTLGVLQPWHFIVLMLLTADADAADS
jgi:hypothetical protein